jgi:uncharacterized protein YecT (DUF1311 family)
MKNYLAMMIFASTCVALPAFALNCDAPQTDADIVACLGAELKDSDVKINQPYRALMGKLDESAQRTLRDQQRAWLRRRDATCKLDRQETDRERWLHAILKDDKRTVCVMRFHARPDRRNGNQAA